MKRLIPMVVIVVGLLTFLNIAATRAPAPPRKAPPVAPVTKDPTVPGLPPRGNFWEQPGRKFHAGQPGKPAVLLFHGLHRDIRCWTNPGDDEGVLCYTYKEQPGKRSLGAQSYPGVGIYKIGVTDRNLEINANNFFDYLASRGFTVGAFSQGAPMIADAMPTARDAYDAFLAETQKKFPDAPPPVCLLGHSRGGLIIRNLLKERKTAPRVKWVVTLHSPHGGSDVARTPAVVEEKIRERIAAALPKIGIVESDIGKQVQDDVIAALKPMFVYLDNKLDDESRELAPDSDFMKGLKDGEKPTDGVSYFTFGGTNPNYMRLYYWTFTANSSVPQYKVSLTNQKQYFKWEIVPHEITDSSPIYSDVAQKILPEVTLGQGDGLVAVERSKLAWASTHKTDDLNHAEVLFDRGIQRDVAAILGDRGVLDDIAKNPTVALATTQSTRKGVELSRQAAAAATQRVPPPRTEDEMADVNFGGVEPSGGQQQQQQQQATGQAINKKLPTPIRRGSGGSGGGSTQPTGGALPRLPTDAAAEGAGAAAFTSVANPQLQGRLGRIVVAFPKDAPCKETHIAIKKSADDARTIHAFYGNGAHELMPGKYVVVINAKRVADVAVESKHDATLRTGALKVHAGAETHVTLLDADGKTQLTTGYGNQEWGLPVGTYHVQVAGQSEAVEVTEGKVTEF